jgi:respiratory burst oxidase
MKSGALSPASSSLSWGSGNFSYDGEEFVEVTLDLHDNNTVILRSVEPALPGNDIHDTASFDTSPCSSRSSSVRRSSSNRFMQLSQELKAEAVARARQFSQELKAEFKRLSKSRSKGSGRTTPSSGNGEACSAIESALAARAARRQRAMLDRSRSGAQRAIRGLRFISKSKANAWSEVECKFHDLAQNGFLCRSNFPECIGNKFELYSSLYIAGEVNLL